MSLLPWRVKAFLSNQFPLLYHFAVNCLKPHVGASYWDQQLAATWNERTWPTKNDIIARLTSPEQAILDIACGSGSILRDLKERNYRNLQGLEISNYAVTRLRNEGITMHQGNLLVMPVPDSTFDAVIVSQVLEHVIRRHSFAREIARILKSEGKAFIFVPNDCLGPIDEPEHVIKYRIDTLCKFLEKHFDVISLEIIKDINFSMTIIFSQVQKRKV